MFQDARLFPHLTARQNIRLCLAAGGRRGPRRLDVADVARFFDIADLLDRPVGHLSGGEKSRVALARALVSRPDFLLLDEPFAALDGPRRRAFIGVLLEMHRAHHLPMLVVTHNIDDAAAMARIWWRLKGRAVVAAGDFRQPPAPIPAFQSLLDARDTGAAIPAARLRAAHGEPMRALWLRADHVLLAAESRRAPSRRAMCWGGTRHSILDGRRRQPPGELADGGRHGAVAGDGGGGGGTGAGAGQARHGPWSRPTLSRIR